MPTGTGPEGFEADEVERSFPCRTASLGVNPKPNGDGKGVVDRLFKAGLVTGTEPTCCIGREPIGPTEPMGPVVDLDGICLEEGESARGEALVTGTSEPPRTGLIPELGDEVLLAREGDTMPSAFPWPGDWVSPKGSTLRGDGPRTPTEDGVPPAGLSTREFSSAKLPGGKKAGLSLPYRARCWRARSSRRLSSLIAAGLTERSDLFADISARRPFKKEILKPMFQKEMKSRVLYNARYMPKKRNGEYKK